MVTVNVTFSAKTQLWCVVIVIVLTLMEVATLNGPNVCMVKQKYNITKRVKYRAPMSVRTYEWCLSIPPRCSKWNTEMRDLTRLETEERTAEVAVCCPGFKMKDVSCVPICPNGKTGQGCSEDCPQSKWGPNCVNNCQPCSNHGSCSPVTGECSCQDGWQGESCESHMYSTTSTTTTTTARVEELLTKIAATKPTPPITSTISSTAFIETTSSNAFKTTLLPSTVGNISLASSEPSLTLSSSTTVSTKEALPKSNTPIEETTQIFLTNSSKETSLIPKTTTMEIVPSRNQSVFLGSSIKTFQELSTLVDPMTTSATTLTSPEVKTTSPIMVFLHTTDVLQTTTQSTTVTPTTSKNLKMTSITKNAISENAKTFNVAITEESLDKIITTSTEPNKLPTIIQNNPTRTTIETSQTLTPTAITHKISNNGTEAPRNNRKYVKEIHVEIKTTPIRIIKGNEVSSTGIQQKTMTDLTPTPLMTSTLTLTTDVNTKMETTRRPDATIRYFPTTVKFKPKEIWIRPAQKGESFEGKKLIHDLHKSKSTNKEPAQTTPKTIIVSIIPTSVSYATYKKIALTTSSFLSQATNMTLKTYNKTMDQGFTKPMSVLTTTSSPTTSSLSTTKNYIDSTKMNVFSNISSNVNTSKQNTSIHKAAKTLLTLSNTRTVWKNKTMSLNKTNSMTTVIQNTNSSNSVTISSNSIKDLMTTHKPNVATGKPKNVTKLEKVTKHFKHVTMKPRNETTGKDDTKIAKTVEGTTNATKTKDTANAKTNKVTTQSPDDEETFHILTEPEHITAVMEGKEKERTSVDLISVVSIAGGVMMAVITVAVIIVMLERCRRPRYEDVRKMNDIHMQVMIENNDVPPPYVRSIFHTPLPDPPTSEKCHYQPISTLDRNLKQFMRPVVVQNISPIMLENFRGILECHYDHLPRRSHDFEVIQKHCSIPPSDEDDDELARLRPCSIAESTIEALKCEAKLDVIDSTTSEPLYAEIPCWRPPSEHAIEIMNLNGEAVTEL